MIGLNIHARLLDLFGIEGDYAAGNMVLILDGLVSLTALFAFEYVDTVGI